MLFLINTLILPLWKYHILPYVHLKSHKRDHYLKDNMTEITLSSYEGYPPVSTELGPVSYLRNVSSYTHSDIRQ